MNLFLYNFHKAIKRLKKDKYNETDKGIIDYATTATLKMYANIDAIGEEMLNLTEELSI